jgi:hypothetical protein
MFTMHDWDPATQQVDHWLVGKLRETYPLFAGRDGASYAAGLLAAGKLAVILDGLDEMPTVLRAPAVQALTEQAMFRLILLTRSRELAAVATSTILDGAAAIELQGIDAATAASYLTRIQRDPPPTGWRELIRRLHACPHDALASALSSPLMLGLIRDTYRAGDDVRELLQISDDARHSAQAIGDHLLDRVLPVAYLRRPGESAPRYDLHTAERTLRYIARQMNKDRTRDLQWWRIPAWAVDLSGTTMVQRWLAFGPLFTLGFLTLAASTFGVAALKSAAILQIPPAILTSAALALGLGFSVWVAIRVLRRPPVPRRQTVALRIVYLLETWMVLGWIGGFAGVAITIAVEGYSSWEQLAAWAIGFAVSSFAVLGLGFGTGLTRMVARAVDWPASQPGTRIPRRMAVVRRRTWIRAGALVCGFAGLPSLIVASGEAAHNVPLASGTIYIVTLPLAGVLVTVLDTRILTPAVLKASPPSPANLMAQRPDSRTRAGSHSRIRGHDRPTG